VTATEVDRPLDAVGGPPIPLGRRVELEGRGTTFVREVTGPPGAPTLLLSHGWIASAGLNWFQVFDALGGHFRVLAVDHRGHGRGLRSWSRFRLADCADDAAALLDVLGTGPVIAVGYSMGGPISQLLWHRHRDKVSGLVLAATSHSFVKGAREQYTFTTAMAAAAGTTRLGMLAGSWAAWPVTRLFPRAAPVVAAPQRAGSMQSWAAAEMRRHDPRHVLEAGHAIGTYDARPWIGQVDVPTTVLVTTDDKAIRPDDQRRLTEAIPEATEHEVADGHMLCAKPQFAAPLLAACLDVAART
jgi:pimeloyl-ACP methyl ester carboxylesterase